MRVSFSELPSEYPLIKKQKKQKQTLFNEGDT